MSKTKNPHRFFDDPFHKGRIVDFSPTALSGESWFLDHPKGETISFSLSFGAAFKFAQASHPTGGFDWKEVNK